MRFSMYRNRTACRWVAQNIIAYHATRWADTIIVSIMAGTGHSILIIFPWLLSPACSKYLNAWSKVGQIEIHAVLTLISTLSVTYSKSDIHTCRCIPAALSHTLKTSQTWIWSDRHESARISTKMPTRTYDVPLKMQRSRCHEHLAKKNHYFFFSVISLGWQKLSITTEAHRLWLPCQTWMPILFDRFNEPNFLGLRSPHLQMLMSIRAMWHLLTKTSLRVPPECLKLFRKSRHNRSSGFRT